MINFEPEFHKFLTTKRKVIRIHQSLHFPRSNCSIPQRVSLPQIFHQKFKMIFCSAYSRRFSTRSFSTKSFQKFKLIFCSAHSRRFSTRRFSTKSFSTKSFFHKKFPKVQVEFFPVRVHAVGGDVRHLRRRHPRRRPSGADKSVSYQHK